MPDRSEIDALKARVDLVELVRSAGVPLKKVGKNWTACCPFHEDSEASFVVNSEAQLFNCFGCKTGGDSLRFLQLREECDFNEALAKLSQVAGLLPAPRKNGHLEPPADEELPGGFSRVELLTRVAEHYSQALARNPVAVEALEARGLNVRQLLSAFGVGYADGSLLGTLDKKSKLGEALTRLGVLTAQGRELLGGCLVVPLSHPECGLVGLYGRKVAPQARVRHLYLPGPKRGFLNWQTLRAAPSELVVTESVFDALSFWVAGVRNVTCLYGSQGLPVDFLSCLANQEIKRLYLCLDDDQAGREATLRLSAQLEEAGFRCHPVPLGEGRDPNQVLTEEGPEGLLRALDRVRKPSSFEAETPAPRPTPVPARKPYSVEKTGDGFTVSFGGVDYRVTPRGPFTGRLHVTLRAQSGQLRHIDTLNLYSDKNRTAVIRKLRERLGLAEETLEKHLAVLLGIGEDWVAELEARTEDEAAASNRPAKARPMTEEERQEALEFLKTPHLLEAVRADMEALGYVGEETGKILGLLIGISRKLPSPLSGIVLSQSGAGKSGLTGLVESLTPPEDVILFSRLSPQALVYVPRDFLKRKLLIIEERKGAEAADYSIRVLQSKQRLSSAVAVKDPTTGKMSTKTFEVEGPIAYLETTTNPNIDHENATRCFLIELDESEEQTRRIHARQREARRRGGLVAQNRCEAILQRYHNAQRLLEPVQVEIPFADQLEFPSRWLRTRRDNENFLSLVEVVAFLHQFQREREVLAEGEVRVTIVRATPEDYRVAYDLAKDVLRSTFHELSRAGRELWARVLELPALLGEPAHQVRFTRRELRQHTGWQEHRLRDALRELVEMEYLQGQGSQGVPYTYRLLVFDEAGPAVLSGLTTPDELERKLRL